MPKAMADSAVAMARPTATNGLRQPCGSGARARTGSSAKASGARPFSEDSIGMRVSDTTSDTAMAMATVSA